MIEIRSEQPGDHGRVHEVNVAAFGQAVEADLVDELRKVARPQLSFVAEAESGVVGHVFFSPVVVRDPSGDVDAMALAPMAVAPEYQRRGIGSALVNEGLAACRRIHQPLVFVLGHPGFYPRFGFEPAHPRGLWFREPGENPAFFFAELEADAASGLTGEVAYHAAFDGV